MFKYEPQTYIINKLFKGVSVLIDYANPVLFKTNSELNMYFDIKQAIFKALLKSIYYDLISGHFQFSWLQLRVCVCVFY